ncbi:MAG: Holliday junction resolvase RuvX [Clostridiales bacterium]|jgi:putative Holliday junction resolvase|nr:Holliday junction resolvase RuvX [Clostridiales bacterium]
MCDSGRVLSIDYGGRAIGIAVSDELRTCAFGLEVIRRADESAIKPVTARLREIMREYGVTEVVLGLPKTLDNRLDLAARKVMDFQERLSRNFKSVRITLWDERFSTVGAERTLRESGFRGKKSSAVIDEAAAVFILQGYLEYLRNQNKNKETEMSDDDFNNEEFDDLDVLSIVDDETGEQIDLEIIASAEHNGVTYHLVVELPEDEDGLEEAEEEADCLILKETEAEGEAVYEVLSDDSPDFEGIAGLFDEFIGE